MKILIVDDQIEIIKMVSRRLKKAGYEIHSASNGKEGIELALALKPDLILMDMHMPVMDGYTATRRLRDQGYMGLISALTASAMATDAHKSIKAGCNYCITKPISADFENQIKEIIEGKLNAKNPNS